MPLSTQLEHQPLSLLHASLTSKQNKAPQHQLKPRTFSEMLALGLCTCYPLPLWNTLPSSPTYDWQLYGPPQGSQLHSPTVTLQFARTGLASEPQLHNLSNEPFMEIKKGEDCSRFFHGSQEVVGFSGGTSRWWLVHVSPTYRGLIWIGSAVQRAPCAQPLSDFSISVLPSGTVRRRWMLLTSAPQLQAHSICQNISYDHMVRLILLWMLHQYTCFYREQQTKA